MKLLGSPPRRQGKANWHCVRRPALRITPAHAGKRTRSWRAYGCPWDHPRVGGEKASEESRWWALKGSPPHRRGKDRTIKTIAAFTRITPAWAGKSPWGSGSFLQSQDHPRVGGEKMLDASRALSWVGSPPRRRGKVLFKALCETAFGITPA